MIDLSPESSRWSVGSRDVAAEQLLSQELQIPSVLAGILVQRGYTNADDASRFLKPRIEDLHDPRLLPDYDAAVAAIMGAKERREHIFVHGDYDVDGVTSAALLSRFLQAIGCQVTTHVPHRLREGYGIHLSAVEAARAAGAKLFLTCDCGTAAIDQVDKARDAGMAVVVTDHHSIGATLPAANAVVNPHRIDSNYPFSDLSGVGVVLKLCAGLTQSLGHETTHFYRAYLDLAALGTIADVMPLVGENRIIAKYGLDRLRETKKIGLQSLMRIANLDAETAPSLRAYHVGFVLGPRLNAAGRIDDADLALRLLMTTKSEEANDLATKIESMNTARRQEQQRTCDEAAEIVVSQGLDRQQVIVVASQAWHPGIVGIVAGRLVEQFRRPAFVLTLDPATKICRGSARTIPKFHLAEAIRAFPDLFLSGGGHEMAAGCSFEFGRIDEVRRALNEFADARLQPEDYLPTLAADFELGFNEMNLEAAQSLRQLEPFGCGNPEPVFVARAVRFAQINPTKSPQHVQVQVSNVGNGVETKSNLKGIAFNLGERVTKLGCGSDVDLLVQLSVDEWRGAQSLKLKLKDLHPVSQA